MANLADALAEMAGQNLFIAIHPEVADFTEDRKTMLILRTVKQRIDIPLPPDRKNAVAQISWIRSFFNDHGKQPLIIGWDLKNLYSYVLGKTGTTWFMEGEIMDLQVLEWYLGIDGQRPDSFKEAASRLAVVCEHKSWEDLKTIYSRIYKPLLTTVVPDMEVLGIGHKTQKKLVHAHYDVAGQLNGRMKASKSYHRGFNPHSISPSEKKLLRPPWVDDSVFLYLDFRNMEVRVLQWLSGDPVLKETLDSGEDVYCQIWTRITGMKCDDEYRKKCKQFFLPVVYGMGASAAAERLGFGDIGLEIYDRMHQRFPVCMDWIFRRQKDVVDGQAADMLGRCRKFDQNELYKIRNFVVQSPAALFCLDKLVRLDRAIKKVAKLGFHVHDGYMLFVKKGDQKEASRIAIEVLEAESDLFPNLEMKVSCQVGETLDELQSFEDEQ